MWERTLGLGHLGFASSPGGAVAGAERAYGTSLRFV